MYHTQPGAEPGFVGHPSAYNLGNSLLPKKNTKWCTGSLEEEYEKGSDASVS